MAESARRATPADRDELVLLARTARRLAEEQRGGPLLVAGTLRPEPLEPAFEAAVADERCLVLIGAYADVPVGYALVRLDDLADARRVGVVEELFVLPDARGVGVGEALMDEVTGWCRDAGCVGIDAVALPGDRDTKNFFETFGLVARAIVVHRPL